MRTAEKMTSPAAPSRSLGGMVILAWLVRRGPLDGGLPLLLWSQTTEVPVPLPVGGDEKLGQLAFDIMGRG